MEYNIVSMFATVTTTTGVPIQDEITQSTTLPPEAATLTSGGGALDGTLPQDVLPRNGTQLPPGRVLQTQDEPTQTTTLPTPPPATLPQGRGVQDPTPEPETGAPRTGGIPFTQDLSDRIPSSSFSWGTFVIALFALIGVIGLAIRTFFF